jgi:hypothetical protein
MFNYDIDFFGELITGKFIGIELIVTLKKP